MPVERSQQRSGRSRSSSDRTQCVRVGRLIVQRAGSTLNVSGWEAGEIRLTREELTVLHKLGREMLPLEADSEGADRA